MDIITQAKKILSKEEKITLQDYKEFCKLRSMAKDEETRKAFLWLSEGMFQLTPIIASRVGSYNFLEEEDK